jgi:hypothetical protein
MAGWVLISVIMVLLYLLQLHLLLTLLIDGLFMELKQVNLNANKINVQ